MVSACAGPVWAAARSRVPQYQRILGLVPPLLCTGTPESSSTCPLATGAHSRLPSPPCPRVPGMPVTPILFPRVPGTPGTKAVPRGSGKRHAWERRREAGRRPPWQTQGKGHLLLTWEPGALSLAPGWTRVAGTAQAAVLCPWPGQPRGRGTSRKRRGGWLRGKRRGRVGKMWPARGVRQSRCYSAALFHGRGDPGDYTFFFVQPKLE